MNADKALQTALDISRVKFGSEKAFWEALKGVSDKIVKQASDRDRGTPVRDSKGN